ncbi:TonB-dependent receptor [Aureivirga sp. CE67]|uniref:TonB-dependent receptor n=1 Tax=Aureivirga sp. CE67 TaxID=1788983 RepID=UPI0018CB41A0|nr:TonB-dependent receptor [Aureivirga sp. CE67]
MKNFKNLLIAMLMITSSAIFAQAKLTGVVTDETGPLPGADVIVKGTTKGASTDFDGIFTIDVEPGSGTVEISFMGYTTQSISYSVSNGETKDLGTINLKSNSVGLEEINIVASVATGRKTPVAVSTIKAAEIQEKLGNQEYPEILKTTPGVYATKQGGGYGDSRINLRGFNSENIAVLINGIPVNDMENGRVYWSNWAGLSDVTSSMQVQRGLGAARVAVPSIGGTINIISKTTDVEKGGKVMASTGNDGYQKYGFTLSTGLMDNGLAATVSASRTTGNGFVDGTSFEGYSYFANISKKINDAHKLSFTIFGAPQEHDQRTTRASIADYKEADRGIRFNPDFGYKNGQEYSARRNFYHKPQASLNHYWNINDNMMLSTVLYGSIGKGGGTGLLSSGAGRAIQDDIYNYTSSAYRFGPYQAIDFDKVVQNNIAQGDAGSNVIRRASKNNHNWYGILSNLNTTIGEKWTLSGGVDLRYYRGMHFREVEDLLGGKYYVDNSNDNNPMNRAKVGDKIAYNNDGVVLWEGLFGQLEYDNDVISGFVSLAGSNTSYKRIDYFNYLDSDPEQETDFQNFLGFSAKGGINWNIDETHNVFFNTGYFEKAPNFDAVFQNFQNIINADAVNQKIFSLELGYGIKLEKFRSNINVYRTQWKDRTFVKRDVNQDGIDIFGNLTGVNAIHQGIEFDFTYNPTEKLGFKGMVSVGDWFWQNNILDVQLFDGDQNPVGDPVNLFIKDLKVGDAAQTTASLGVNYEIINGVRLSADYIYYDNLYADFNPSNRTSAAEEGVNSWKLPSYGLVDLGLRWKFNIKSLDATLNANVNNVFGTEYVSDALDGRTHNASTAAVYYGAGRTYTVGTKIKF